MVVEQCAPVHSSHRLRKQSTEMCYKSVAWDCVSAVWGVKEAAAGDELTSKGRDWCKQGAKRHGQWAMVNGPLVGAYLYIGSYLE